VEDRQRRSAGEPRRGGTERAGGPFPAPRRKLPGFPDAELDRPKTRRGDGGGLRKRWRDPDGTIYEWDYQHGTVEKYDRRGRHLGEYDAVTGEQLKGPDPTRRVEP
jgi:hypothetical protein